MKTFLLFCILICFCGQASAFTKKECLSYEPTVVTLRGILVEKTFPGPPNYEDVKKGDLPETNWLLKLDSPICMNEDVASQGTNNTAKTGIREVTLVFIDRGTFKKYAGFLGRKVVAKGTLFGELTGHHHTPVLMTVKNLSVQ